MGGYESDSSGGEGDDFTETNVLLGYASGDANGEEISRLGGVPVRLRVASGMPKLTCLGLARSLETALGRPSKM